MQDMQRFERSMLDEIQAFNEGKPWAKKRQAPSAAVNLQQTIVRLAVRTRQYLALDVEFVHRSNKLSRLEARLEAEAAARAAGYPVIGYVVDIHPA